MNYLLSLVSGQASDCSNSAPFPSFIDYPDKTTTFSIHGVIGVCCTAHQTVAASSDDVDDACLISVANSCRQLRALSVRGSARLGRDGVSGLARRLDQLHSICLHDCARVDDAALGALTGRITLCFQPSAKRRIPDKETHQSFRSLALLLKS